MSLNFILKSKFYTINSGVQQGINSALDSADDIEQRDLQELASDISGNYGPIIDKIVSYLGNNKQKIKINNGEIISNLKVIGEAKVRADKNKKEIERIDTVTFKK